MEKSLSLFSFPLKNKEINIMFNKGKLDYVDWGWKLFKAAFMFTNDCEARTPPPSLKKGKHTLPVPFPQKLPPTRNLQTYMTNQSKHLCSDWSWHLTGGFFQPNSLLNQLSQLDQLL